MAIEKSKKLRKIELIFTNDKVHDVCHCVYDIIIVEDGNEIARSTHRSNRKIGELKELINKSEIFMSTNTDSM